jgi:hypothetical protein
MYQKMMPLVTQLPDFGTTTAPAPTNPTHSMLRPWLPNFYGSIAIAHLLHPEQERLTVPQSVDLGV